MKTTARLTPMARRPRRKSWPASTEDIAPDGVGHYRHYANGSIYRFSCDASWETQNDTDFKTIDDARDAPSAQYDVTRIEWRAWTP